MRKIFSLCVMSLAMVLGFVACDDDESAAETTPSLSVSLVETTLNSATIEVQAVNMTSVYYLLQAADEEAASADEVVSEGSLMQDTKLTVNGLEQDMSYRVTVVGRNETLSVEQMETLEFTTRSVTQDATDFTSAYTDIWWYGPYSEGVDQFFVQLSSVEVEPLYARPQGGGQIVRFYVFAPATTADDMRLAPGTYTLGGDTNEEGTFWRDGSVYAIGSTADDWMQVGFKSGKLTVEYNDGVYTMSADLVLNDGYDTPVKATYQGEARIEDLSAGFRQVYDDLEHQQMTGAGGYVSKSSVTDLDCYMVTLWNTPIDEDGFVIGAGYVAQLCLYTSPLPYGEFDFSGEYTVDPDAADGIFPEGTYYPGYVYDNMGMKSPQGTYLALCGDDGAVGMAAFAADGPVTVKKTGNVYTIQTDFVSDTGVRFSFSYEGEVTLADYRTPSMSSKVPRSFLSFPVKAQPIKTIPLTPGWHKF